MMDFTKTKLFQRTCSFYDQLYSEYSAKKKGNGNHGSGGDMQSIGDRVKVGGFGDDLSGMYV